MHTKDMYGCMYVTLLIYELSLSHTQHAHSHTRTHAHTHTRTHAHTHTRTHAHTHTRTHAHTHTRTHAHTHDMSYVCMHACGVSLAGSAVSFHFLLISG
jgi:hypothetical protein